MSVSKAPYITESTNQSCLSYTKRHLTKEALLAIGLITLAAPFAAYMAEMGPIGMAATTVLVPVCLIPTFFIFSVREEQKERARLKDEEEQIKKMRTFELFSEVSTSPYSKSRETYLKTKELKSRYLNTFSQEIDSMEHVFAFLQYLLEMADKDENKLNLLASLVLADENRSLKKRAAILETLKLPTQDSRNFAQRKLTELVTKSCFNTTSEGKLSALPSLFGGGDDNEPLSALYKQAVKYALKRAFSDWLQSHDDIALELTQSQEVPYPTSFISFCLPYLKHPYLIELDLRNIGTGFGEEHLIQLTELVKANPCLQSLQVFFKGVAEERENEFWQTVNPLLEAHKEGNS